MLTIQPFNLNLVEAHKKQGFSIQTPENAVILKVESASITDVTLWIHADSEDKPIPRTFLVRKSGEDTSDCGKYLGTVLILFEFRHVFEAKPKDADDAKSKSKTKTK